MKKINQKTLPSLSWEKQRNEKQTVVRLRLITVHARRLPL